MGARFRHPWLKTVHDGRTSKALSKRSAARTRMQSQLRVLIYSSANYHRSQSCGTGRSEAGPLSAMDGAIEPYRDVFTGVSSLAPSRPTDRAT